MNNQHPIEEFNYDVCLSFAGEQREYVRNVADRLIENNIRVFFDEFEEAALWGQDLYDHLAEIYGRRAKYCIIFASAEYAAKAWTGHERKAAQERALKEIIPYVLPARFDQTIIPGLNSNIAYIDLSRRSPSEIADLFIKKLGREVESTVEHPRDIFARSGAGSQNAPTPEANQRRKQLLLDLAERAMPPGATLKRGKTVKLPGYMTYYFYPDLLLTSSNGVRVAVEVVLDGLNRRAGRGGNLETRYGKALTAKKPPIDEVVLLVPAESIQDSSQIITAWTEHHVRAIPIENTDDFAAVRRQLFSALNREPPPGLKILFLPSIR